ncbi:hypothetical protein P7K49_017060 [Saguinus oedipus]|uniref:Uncharacterized protein n=1 Tax=Saguinus oedipus TaxID=9490 RepID=A0ABQ9V1E3_SAGOE|nr:hypothetical protein P7K49_017060 [Saguinus oedipus]
MSDPRTPVGREGDQGPGTRPTHSCSIPNPVLVNSWARTDVERLPRLIESGLWVGRRKVAKDTVTEGHVRPSCDSASEVDVMLAGVFGHLTTEGHGTPGPLQQPPAVLPAPALPCPIASLFPHLSQWESADSSFS